MYRPLCPVKCRLACSRHPLSTTSILLVLPSSGLEAKLVLDSIYERWRSDILLASDAFSALGLSDAGAKDVAAA